MIPIIITFQISEYVDDPISYSNKILHYVYNHPMRVKNQNDRQIFFNLEILPKKPMIKSKKMISFNSFLIQLKMLKIKLDSMPENLKLETIFHSL